MTKIEIYTTPFCGYCLHAKRLLQKKSVEFVEYDVSRDPELRQEMIKRSQGATSVPQIFINDHSIGGCDELYDLEYDKKLDQLLAKN